MAFVAPIVVGAIGLTGIGATVATIGINAGLAVGMAYAAQKLAPKPKKSAGPTGVSVSLSVATDGSRECIFGECWTGGQLGYWHVSGAGNKYLQMALLLASHEIDSITDCRINGHPVTWDQETGAVSEYPGMKLTLHKGDQTTADADLVASSGGRLTSDDVGHHIAYVAVTMEYSAETYPQGIPSFAFRVRGAKLYDARKDTTAGGAGSHRFADPSTWEYSDNPTVILAHIMRGFDGGTGIPLVGLNAPAAAIPYAEYAAAANACDEDVSLKAGGTEKRYRCGFRALCTATAEDAIDMALAAMGGMAIHSGGIYRIHAGVSRTPVAALTDDDIIQAEPLVTAPRASMSELVNTVAGSYADPELFGQGLKPLPQRSSSLDVAADGGFIRTVDLDLASVFSGPQAQRLMELTRKRARRMGKAEFTARARWSVLEPGDWITFSSDRRGYVEATFEVAQSRRQPDHRVALVLREVDAGADDWTAATDELDDDASADLPPGQAALTAISGLALVTISVEGPGGIARPGLRATWTPPGDPTITEVVIEYRKYGDTVALERRAMSADAGQYAWLDGVQGGLTYEARIRPVTMPERGVEWTAWASTPTDTPAQIVAVAAMALDIDPELIPEAELDAQSKFELALATALDTTQASVNERLSALRAQIVRISEALAETQAWTDENDAYIRREEVTRTTETESLAQITTALGARLDDPSTGLDATAMAVSQVTARVEDTEDGLIAAAEAIDTLSTTVGGHTDSITQILSLEGGKKRFAIVFDENGKFTGGISLDGEDSITTLDIAVSALNVYDPSVNGGTPVPLLQVATVGGVPQMILNGTFIAKAIEAGVINALSGSIGHLTSAKITSPNGRLLIDATGANASIQITSDD